MFKKSVANSLKLGSSLHDAQLPVTCSRNMLLTPLTRSLNPLVGVFLSLMFNLPRDLMLKSLASLKAKITNMDMDMIKLIRKIRDVIIAVQNFACTLTFACRGE